MISPAAQSLSSTLALATGIQAGSGGEMAVPGDFAALLEATSATGEEGASEPAGALDLAIAQHMRQVAGKPAGKILPLEPEAAGREASSNDAVPTDDAIPTDDAVPTDDASFKLPVVSSEIVLPGLVVLVRSQPAQAASPARAIAPNAPATSDALAKAIAAQAASSVPSGSAGRHPVNAVEVRPGETAAPTAVPELPMQPARIANAEFVVAASPTAQSDQLAAAKVKPQIKASARPMAEAALQEAGSQAPARELAPAPQVPIRTPVAEAGAPDIQRIVVSAPNSAKPAGEPSAASKIPVEVQVGARSGEPAIPGSNSPQHDAQPDVRAARELPPIAASASTGQKALAEPRIRDAQPSVDDRTQLRDLDAQATRTPAAAVGGVQAPQRSIPVQLPAETMGSAEPAPVLSSVDGAAPAPQVHTPASGQSVSVQAVAMPDAQPVSPSPNAIGTAHSTAAVPTGHDFAALVDRLVEARQTAQPHTVHAALSHSEFGQVSLQFQQDAGGLSVAMSSADPDFADAVQASVASAQSQNASDNGSTGPRHEAAGQQQSTNSGQPQSQASARNDRNPQQQGESRLGQAQGQQRHTDRDRGDSRDGIYA